MKLIKSSFEIIEQEPGILGMLRHVEKAGRTCYKSEDKITDDSAVKFADMLIKRGHTACLEQGTVYLTIPIQTFIGFPSIDKISRDPLLWRYFTNPYSKVNFGASAYVTTNYRVLYENNWLDNLQFMKEPTKHHAKRVTVRFICDRGVSHELVRHRVFSFAQESTRYCNYSKDKFGNELTFIIPSWLDMIPEGNYKQWPTIGWSTEETLRWSKLAGSREVYDAIQNFFSNISCCQDNYMWSISDGFTPQQARQLLPNALKTEVVMTGFINDWSHFFNLRCAQDAHPDMRKLAQPLFEEFCHREYIHTEG